MKDVKRILAVFAVAVMGLAVSTPVEGQRTPRMPREGGWSVLAGLGWTNPTDEDFDVDFGFSGGIDYYLTRNFSLGALAGAWSADTPLGEDGREAYVDFTATYNWEGGKIHPFVQAGVGPYFVDFPGSDDNVEAGGFLGGGVDFFFTPTTAVDFSFRYHIVPDVDFGFNDNVDAKFFEAHGGVKFYF